MRFITHSELKDKHAFLGASRHSWINYSEEQLLTAYDRHTMSARGTRLHEFAKEAILLGIKLPKTKQTLNMYVNDAIGFKMIPEQPLYYSDNCFGTADTISFRKHFLRIHDYKSGLSPVSMAQIDIYTALFCLEYEINPEDIGIENRIYHLNEIIFSEPERSKIRELMNRIILFDKKIESIKREE